MKPIANHRTGDLGKNLMLRAWGSGDILPLSEPLQVPVLTTSNHKEPILADVMGRDPLFYLDKRPEEQWDWWLKVESAETYAAKFRDEGHEHFLYIDSNDGFLWRSFTNEECKEFLGDKDIRFQEHVSGYPAYEPMAHAFRKLMGTTHGGLCAGCYVARTDTFQSFVDVLRVFKNAKVRAASHGDDWLFDDQAAWRALACLMPDRIGIQEDSEIITRRLPGKNMWGVDVKLGTRGLGDSMAAVLKKFGIKSCESCKNRQEVLNKIFPYQRSLFK